MTAVLIVLALLFAVAAGAIAAWARVSQPRRRALLSGAAGVCFLQTLTFMVIASIPSLENTGYVVAVVVVGLALSGSLIFLAKREDS